MEKQIIEARLAEIDQLFGQFTQQQFNPLSTVKAAYQPGITVIVPTYQGEERIMNCLQLLRKQSLAPLFFDVIFIINGEKDATETIINEFLTTHELDHFHVEYREEANVSKARNVGIERANREFITFLDDDDTISENYLEKLYQYASYDTVSVAQMIDIKQDKTMVSDNLVNKQIVNQASTDDANILTLSYVVSLNACKALPTAIVKQHAYTEQLKSGEDIVFFTELFIKHPLKIKVIPLEDEAIYYRHLREDSVSRQALSYHFYVEQRLEVLKRLDNVRKQTKDAVHRSYITSKLRGQISFIRKYLAEYPEQREDILEKIAAYEFSYFPYESLEPVEPINEEAKHDATS